MTQYQKLTQLEHVLTRPDTYVGSLENTIDKHWIPNEDKMVQRNVVHVPGLYKIYDEVLVNAIDQCVMDNTVDKITVDIADDTITIMNTGKGIPIKIHEKEKIYIPELIFGNLLTSSNYDDSQKRVVGGRNGYGAKLANIFSEYFSIEIHDMETKKVYKQTWSKNMTEKTEPEIKNKQGTTGYVKFTFKPDYNRFKMKGIDKDTYKLFEKRVYDACACTPDRVSVYFNKVKLNFKNFEKYIDMFIGDKKDNIRVNVSNPRWEICIAQSNDGFKQVSFVNGVATSVGGTHVEYIVRQLVQKITEKINQKHSELQIKPTFVREHLFVFIKATLENPSFSSQTKTECTLKVNNFGSKCEINDDVIKKIFKMPIIDEITALAKHKEMRELTKTDGKKKCSIKGIPKLDDANKAGTNLSGKCTLILTEGDSAKTFAISGLSVVGRDFYGIFPLRGKLLNVREATAKQLLENAEINHLKQILGLQQNKTYSSVSELRYGKVMILTDADVDGSHIKGLIVNFFHHFWPTLFTLKDAKNFVCSMITPILKVTKGASVKSFYSLNEYKEWKDNNDISGWKVKYYKGLGTSTSTEAKDYFKNLNQSVIKYKDINDECMNLAFKKEKADERKTWIQGGITRNEVLDYRTKEFSYPDLINKDLIWFSIADVQRSIPHVMDGLKPSQRKVLYACRKRKNTEVKVSQLSGYVSTETAYHHGEQSLMGTIINMAQDFVGSNTYNLLSPIGQFGTRLMGGKDAASSRYIFTKLSKWGTQLFDDIDDNILNYLDDDGMKIEPEYYVPIIPLILVNGGEGIGTGYSSFVPCYNPKDIVENMKRCINDEELKDLHPWYPNFKGTIEKQKDSGYTTTGVWKRGKQPNVIEISELPIGKWTSDYKDYLDSILDTKIEHFENHSTETEVRFMIKMKEYNFDPKILKLTTNLSISNMHLFSHNGKIKKYKSPNEIIEEFTDIRLDYFEKRKNYVLKTLKNELVVLSNKVRFITHIVDKTLVIFNKPKTEISEELLSLNFDQIDDSFDYLLNMKIYSLTKEQIETMKLSQQKKQNEITVWENHTDVSLLLDSLLIF